MARRSAKYNYGSFSPGIKHSRIHSYNTSSSKRKKSTSISYVYSSQENDGCARLLAMFVMVICFILFIWSFSWSWRSHSSYSRHHTVPNYKTFSYTEHHDNDLSGLKWIYYPIVVGGFAFGLIGYISMRPPKGKRVEDDIIHEQNVVNNISASEPAEEIKTSLPHLDIKQLKEGQNELRNIYNIAELRRKVALLNAEARKLPEHTKIENLNVNSYISMNDYYLRTQTEKIVRYQINDFSEDVGEILVLLSEIDDIKPVDAKARVNLRFKYRMYENKMKPILYFDPDYCIFDIKVKSLIVLSESLLNYKLKGEKFDITFNSLLHK